MTRDVLYANLKKKYDTLINKLSSIFNQMTSNICIIRKNYNTTTGRTVKDKKCLLDPDEDKFNESLDQKMMDFNRARAEVPRYRITISGRDFDDVFVVDTGDVLGAIEESKSIVISLRNLTLIDVCFLRADAQLLPLN